VSALSGPAKAAKIMAVAMLAEAAKLDAAGVGPLPGLITRAIGAAYAKAADDMEAQIRAECSPPPAGPSVPIAASPTSSRPPRR
jgi:hypothetical protein